MKLKKFFEERLKLIKASRHESRVAEAIDDDSNAAGVVSGKASQRVAAAAAVHQCAGGGGGGSACRCLACAEPNSQRPLFHASAPAAVGLRTDHSPLGESAGRRAVLVRGADWIRPPASGHCVAALQASAAVAASAADRSLCATIVEAAAEAECEPLAPDQYYTVPRCRSRIKTNPWIPTPHSIACREGAPCLCRRQSDTTAAGGSLLLSAGDAYGRLMPADAAAASPCYDGYGGFSSGESGYATTGRRCSGDWGACDDEACLSLNEDDYYDWHETLLEAFTPITRGDSVSSADESSVGRADYSDGGVGTANETAPPPSAHELLPIDDGDGGCCCGSGVDLESGCSDDPEADARGGGGSRPLAATAAAGTDSAAPALPAAEAASGMAGGVGLAARVQRLREYKSVLHEKIRLARIECQLILSSLPSRDEPGGCSGDEEAR